MFRTIICVAALLLTAACGHPALDGRLDVNERASYQQTPPEYQAPPLYLRVSLLQVYGGSSERVGWNTFRVQGIAPRPVDVTVQGWSQRWWWELRTSGQVPGDAIAYCRLGNGGPVPSYNCTF